MATASTKVLSEASYPPIAAAAELAGMLLVELQIRGPAAHATSSPPIASSSRSAAQ